MKAYIFIKETDEFWWSGEIEENEKADFDSCALLAMYKDIGGEPKDISFGIDEEGAFYVEREVDDEDEDDCEGKNKTKRVYDTSWLIIHSADSLIEESFRTKEYYYLNEVLKHNDITLEDFKNYFQDL